MRRPTGTGSVYQRRSDGLWAAAIRINGKRLVRYAKTKREAYRLLEELRAQRPVRPDPRSLGAYLDQWLEAHRANLRPKTAQRYAELLKHLPDELKAQRLSDLKPPQLAALYQALLGQLKPATIRQLHAVLRKALNDAVSWGLLAASPAARVKPPRCQPYRPSLWSPTEVQTFLGAVLRGEAGRYGPLLGFLLGTGCRLGEALGLTWHDLDLGRGVVRIERSLTQVRGRWVESAPKTPSSVRTVSLPAWCLELLREHKARASSVRVFCSAAGTPPSPSNLRRALHALCRRLSLPVIRLHDLRHISLSLLLLAGLPVKLVQERAGHSSPTVTLGTYGHMLGLGDGAAARALDKLAEGEAVKW